jgi:uncharacterized protein (TIGR00255 family)
VSEVIKSMTGFAAVSGSDARAKWDWELRAVNNRGLDVRLRLPEGCETLEPQIRKLAATRIKRGNVSVNLKLQRTSADGALDRAALERGLARLLEIDQIAKEAGVALAPSNALDVVTSSESGLANTGWDLPADIGAQLPELFENFDKMRCTEGAELLSVLRAQLAYIAKLTEAADHTAGIRDARAKTTLKERVNAVLEDGQEIDSDRLAQEIAVLVVKSDVTEELDRLRAHVTAVEDLLRDGGSVGRKLDFLMQEFNREANTLCSKSQDAELTKIGVDMKVIIEQMREQIQNLE